MTNCVAENEIEAFVDKIEGCGRFEIAGLNEDETKFVLRDITKDEGIEGRYIEVAVDEVIDKPLKDIMAILNGDRNDIVLHGVTRIVGYYSRMTNWNKSKIGELRDRAQRNYGLTVESPKFDAERMATINSL